MHFNIISFTKTVLAGAGAGFALTGGLSLAIPAITVTNSFALSMAMLCYESEMAGRIYPQHDCMK